MAFLWGFWVRKRIFVRKKGNFNKVWTLVVNKVWIVVCVCDKCIISMVDVIKRILCVGCTGIVCIFLYFVCDFKFILK